MPSRKRMDFIQFARLHFRLQETLFKEVELPDEDTEPEGVGDELFQKTYVDVDGIRRGAAKEALEEAEKRHTREIKATITRMEKHAATDKARALKRQKMFFDDLARRVAEQRDKAEEERIRQLTKKFEKEMEAALKKQWEECERIKEEACTKALAEQKRRLRNEFALEREKAIADALAHQRERYNERERAVVEKTRSECEERAAEETARVARIHAAQIKRHEDAFAQLSTELECETRDRRNIEMDFKDLQSDYKRFMDYTDGRFHSDYMMRLRRHGMRLAKGAPFHKLASGGHVLEEIKAI